MKLWNYNYNQTGLKIFTSFIVLFPFFLTIYSMQNNLQQIMRWLEWSECLLFQIEYFGKTIVVKLIFIRSFVQAT